MLSIILGPMNIEGISVGVSQAQVQAEAGMKVQKMAQDGMELQAEAVQKLISSGEIPIDPMLGQQIDIQA